MERKADPPSSNLGLPIAGGEANLNHTSSTTSSSSSSSSSNFISPLDWRHISAVFKRHRPLGTMRNISRPSRVLVPQAESAISSISGTSVASGYIGRKLPQRIANSGSGNVGYDQRNDSLVEIRTNPPEKSLLTPPSITESVTNVQDGNMCPHGMLQGEDELLVDRKGANLAASSSHLLSPLVSSSNDLKRDQFSSFDDAGLTFQREEDRFSNQVNVNDNYLKQHDLPNIDRYGTGGAHIRDEFWHKQQSVDPMTQSTIAASSCVTTMSVHSCPTYQCTHPPLAGQSGSSTQMSSAVENPFGVSAPILPKGQEPMVKDAEGRHHHQLHMGESIVDKVVSTNASHLQSQVPCANNLSSNMDKEPLLSSKVEKAPRKKKYDPDVFFKVNGKLYQKLGKIGSGGSSEVHKVITSDCTIYALKKIKLNGRDYPTAYGFCQEIEYLNKLKGKSNIIQLIDYEVTDKTLLQEVMNGSMTVKDGRIKDDQYIYMVLEYGEVDLAHMLSQKWKEVKSSSCNIDENWLRFYWQQMLEAVNTIHEERIVHSDLKPANFLLVRGSLKLIDFGIAKAIMSDTTNIQRDAQVGTLNYMSPEAFMWNEHDSSGNTIKCGRPSDIWSLGCILYQMVYGKTLFAEFKTFWAKFQVITDRSHEITYEPVSNPLLIDLMKRCLAWERNERWRIPQLLKHPFLMPPIPRFLHDNQHYSFLLQKIGVFWNNPEVSRLCSELHEVVANLERAHND